MIVFSMDLHSAVGLCAWAKEKGNQKKPGGAPDCDGIFLAILKRYRYNVMRNAIQTAQSGSKEELPWKRKRKSCC